MKKILIVGGGTSGWLTALMVQRSLTDVQITVVESEEIGILGAGEGTVPNFVSRLDYLGIPVSDLVKRAEATIKNGIKFTNWNGDGTHYYHNFSPIFREALGEMDGELSKYNLSFLLNSYEEIDSDNLDVVSMLNKESKVGFVKKPSALVEHNPIFDFTNFSNFALHFNAKKLAEVLREYAEDRGVLRVEGKVSSVEEDEKGFVKQLITELGLKLECDFVFDCSGFKRLIVGEHYKAQWQDHSKKLSVNSAVPFFIEYRDGEKIPPYTEAIAMKYGWMWKIPVGSRYGCGYVFDRSLISEENAVKEIEEYLGFTPHYPRKDKGGFKFTAGYFKTPWIKNCISIGLSSGFIEPLEATSIFVSTIYLEEALFNPNKLFNYDEEFVKHYNKKCEDLNEEVSDFLFLHYLGDRNDTEFWFRYKNLKTYPKKISDLFNMWNRSVPVYNDVDRSIFGYVGWYSVTEGVNKLNKDIIKKFVEEKKLFYRLPLFYKLKEKQKLLSKFCIEHSDFLKHLSKE